MSASTLHLTQPEGPEDEVVADTTFQILNDFLQPESNSTLEATAEFILAFLSVKASHHVDIHIFGAVCIEVAEQIPYYHPAQYKLVDLLAYLGKRTQFISTLYEPGSEAGKSWSYQSLGESLRDSLRGPENPSTPTLHTNFSAFCAKLSARHVFSSLTPTWAIWALRSAFETDLCLKAPEQYIRDGYVLAAAQWILWDGQNLFKHVLYGQVPETALEVQRDMRAWRRGELWRRRGGRGEGLTLGRWRFWREGFEAVARGEGEEEERDGKGVAGHGGGGIRGDEMVVYAGNEPRQDSGGFGRECRSVGARAAKGMDAIEALMTF